jgi:hypothetical protein
MSKSKIISDSIPNLSIEEQIATWAGLPTERERKLQRKINNLLLEVNFYEKELLNARSI